eukprot:CAMPEP_0178877974 /NCGR_PEP_ID=MMETSP0747-20121128/11142_1 /TAXON_ID=913974 /ORGANISM="Nitzschia punctata, Strain CCMP561" /LENGTH=173 /DNA_ID=CAMNT_0020545689 /DNA_START=472 /DNA_END=992 /DNA_ORIENTATION=-
MAKTHVYLRGANSTMRAALDEAKGTDAFFHVFVAARNALDIVAATSLRGSGTATLGRNEAAIAAKAGDLAAFSSVLVSSAAAPTRFGRHRKATGPTKTQTICRRLAAALDVLGVTCCIATAEPSYMHLPTSPMVVDFDVDVDETFEAARGQKDPPMAEADFVCNVDRFWTSAS